MPLAKCPRCEKLFAKSASIVCPNCTPAEESDYEKVRECLRQHPDEHADAISEMTGVDVKCVLRMVDQGIVASSSSLGATKCGRCGAPAISASKKLCNKCLENLNREMTQQRKDILAAPRKPQPGSESVSVRQVLESRHDKAR